jgi:hypothetical protein
MRWNQDRSHVDRLIADGELQRVPANREHADQLIVQARKDLASARLLLESNPKRAYESVYDAARMALTAVLENEGLRPTSRGGHIAPYAAVSAQLDPPMGTVLSRSTACGGRGTDPSTRRLQRPTSHPTMSGRTFRSLPRSLKCARECSTRCRPFSKLLSQRVAEFALCL